MTTKSMQLGLIFWAKENPAPQLEQLKGFGLSVCQLGVPPELDLKGSVEAWKNAVAAQGVAVTGSACAYAGEDYSSKDAVHETVGFTSPKYREERIQRTKDASDFVAKLGVKSLSCHIGFVPDEKSDPLYKEMIEVAQTICDHCTKHGQDFALETGQESAETLNTFIADVQRPNLKVNFDPANMILHGAGDPIAAVKLLKSHILSVHCKDGKSPKGDGKLGDEVALGNGEVDFPAFLSELKKMNYSGTLTIEREEPNEAQRSKDIELAIERLNKWLSQI